MTQFHGKNYSYVAYIFNLNAYSTFQESFILTQLQKKIQDVSRYDAVTKKATVGPLSSSISKNICIHSNPKVENPDCG